MDWNVVVTIRGRDFKTALAILRDFGHVQKTDYFNLLTLSVEDPVHFPEVLARHLETFPRTMDLLSRVVPVFEAFRFNTVEEFQEKARELVLGYAPELAGKSFHVRLHRRGFKGRINTPEQERSLDELLLDTLDHQGMPGRISFGDPDAVIVLETVGNRAGVSFWTREDILRFPFLKLGRPTT
jgi:tRNA(Ser,Leu) C12 N-acetylase TAN1